MLTRTCVVAMPCRTSATGDQTDPPTPSDPWPEARIREDLTAAGGLDLALDDDVGAWFPSCHDALAAAVTVAQAADRRHRVTGGDSAVRIGIAAGDAESTGAGSRSEALVTQARQLAAAAMPWQIRATSIVHLLANGAPSDDDPWVVEWSSTDQPAAVTVVVAEDVALLRAGLVALLREDGFDVVADVGDREALLAAARKHRPGLVITDVRMPPEQKDEGLTAALELLAEQPDLTVLVISQHIEVAALAQLLAHHTSGIGYLLKERVSDLDDFVVACRTVAAGGVIVDPLVSQQLTQAANGDALERLTDREREVLDLMAQGRSNAAIARTLNCSTRTLETHVRSIFGKLDLPEDPDDHRRVAAVVRYLHRQT
jgi:DNA-binding NarL/FixJ family response regulator